MTQVLLVLLSVVAVAAVLLLWGRASWRRYISNLFSEVRAAASTTVEYVGFEELNELPTPVQKYFRLVLKEGAPIINRTSLVQKGGFRPKLELKEWSAIEATQQFSSSPRAFVWSAKIAMLPGVSIDVCDLYKDGKGGIRGKFLSLFTVIEAKEQKELNEGALQRYLAEAVWFPTALLPSQGVLWSAIDEQRARATVTDGATTTSLEFTFNDNGEIVSAYTPERYREVSGTYESTPWGGRYANYVDINGYLVPIECEVEWYLQEGVYTYFRATLDEILYD